MNASDLGAAVLGVLTLGLLAGSFCFWIVFFQKAVAGETPVPLRFRWRPVRVPRFPLILTLAMLVMYFQAIASSEEVRKLTFDQIRFVVWGTLGEGILILGVLFPAVFLGARKRTDLVRLGFRCDHPGEQVKEGVLGLVAVVIPMGIMLLLTSSIRSAETEHPFLRLLRETGAGYELLAIAVSAVVIAPLKEELMFRVVLQSWLEEFCPAGLAVALSAVIFAAIHGFPDSLALLPLAVGLGYLYQRRRSYLSIVIVHGLFNAFNVLATFVGSESI